MSPKELIGIALKNSRLEVMRDRIKEIDWGEASADAKRFIMARELDSLSAWDYDLFLQQLDRLGSLFA